MDPNRLSIEPLALLQERRYGRRALMLGTAATLPLLATCAGRAELRGSGRRRFAQVPASSDDLVHVADGHEALVLARWGDPLLRGAPSFDPARQTAAAQRLQFGFNCDWTCFVPLRAAGSDEGLLCINHEYTARAEMFRGAASADEALERYLIEIAAHGMSIAHVRRDTRGRFAVVVGAGLNRRITGDTPMVFTGPALGDALLRTVESPAGRQVRGMLGNCAGGRTPWGTVLTCEENVDEYFGNAAVVSDPVQHARLRRYDVADGRSSYGYEDFDPRFDLGSEPNEPNLFGWVVEIDPFDADAMPKKHTALGRFKHEGAAVTTARDGRIAVYMGDDEEFEYLYKFVSARSYAPGDRTANAGVLERGTLHCARFDADGTGEWLPLVPAGALADWTPAEIAVHTRAAADLLGATPMDRPEDIEVDPTGRSVWVCLTKNTRRTEGDGGANPRADNRAGQIVEITEDGGDAAAQRFRWSLFCLFGGPGLEHVACPDNLAIDARGDLWVATDGQPVALGTNDALYRIPTSGAERGVPQRFMTGPIASEVCGPEFTPDERTLFVSIQHPGEGGGLDAPTSLWPHDGSGVPRPSVLAIARSDGAPIPGARQG